MIGLLIQEFNSIILTVYQKPLITIYTDGSCSPNPGKGGWAAVLLTPEQEPRILQGAEKESTNNRMELMAPIRALESLDDDSLVEICTDSKYVRDGISKWISNWQQNDWQTIDGNSVKNKDLWLLLLEQIKRNNVSWRWVKGHSYDDWNNYVDQLATEARGLAPKITFDDQSINIFLGVTCKHSTKVGGWAAVLVYKKHFKILGEKRTDVTPNVLYLEAVISGLLALKKDLPVTIYTSSGYLKDGATSWMEGWLKRNWQTRDGNPVSNSEQWMKLSELQKKHNVEYCLVDKLNPPCHCQEAKELAKEFENSEQ